MTDKTVSFEQVTVHRVLGIGPGEGFQLTDLTPGVNLIYGPNGCGKTTTARVLQALLWPGRTELPRPSVAGVFRYEGRRWQIEIDAGHVTVLRDDETGTVPEYGPPENRHRYRLALHELIQDDNTDFAKAIADASQGGYDVGAAAKTLVFQETPKRRHTERREFERAISDVRGARRVLQGLEADANQLTRLHTQRSEAVAAQRIITLLERVQNYRKADKACRRLIADLGSLAEGVARLRGDERGILDKLKNRREHLEQADSREQQRIRTADETIRQNGLSDEGVADEVMRDLRATCRRLEQLRPDIDQQRRQLLKAREERDSARRRLGDHFTDAQLAALDQVEIGELSLFALNAHRVRAETEALQQRRAWLTRATSDELKDVGGEAVHEGIVALARWLRCPQPIARRTTWLLSLAALAIAILAVLLAILHHWAWALTGLVGVALPVIGRPKGNQREADARAVHQASYDQTGLSPPAGWETNKVAAHLDHLQRQRAQLALVEECRQRLDELHREEEKADTRRRSLEAQRQKLAERLGIRLELDDAWLPLLVDTIGVWQRCDADAASTEKVLEEAASERDDLLAKLNLTLDGFGNESLDSAEAGSLAVENLEARQQNHRDAIRDREEAQRQLDETIGPDLRTVADQRAQLFERLELGEDGESVVDDWLELRPRYLELTQQRDAAQAVRDQLREDLIDHEDLLELDEDSLSGQIEEQRGVADQRDDLTSRITTIENAIDAAKQGHALTDALEAQAEAEGRLADARDENCCQVVGAALADWIREVAIERARPDVYRRADELLIHITRGRLRLKLDDRSSCPAFLAQAGSGPPRPVNELSMGERVQLLMAVRLAFLEQDEIARLPLILDEALGTSDDERAGIIIDGVIDIARSGRQVFYFTAQHDEVGKWMARLADSGVAHKAIDLGVLRGLTAPDSTPLEIVRIERSTPPPPGGLNYEEYGHRLGVRGIDPTREDLDQLHLWHVIDDPSFLYELLCLDISTWGQLRILIDHGSGGIVDNADERFEHVAAAARAIDAACRAWRVGRGKSIDRSVLQDSGHVSEAFIDRLAELAQDSDGDAARFLVDLEKRGVPHWRADNTPLLREYLEQQGYLVGESPSTPSEIRIRILADVGDDLREGRLSQHWLDRLVGSLPPIG